MATVGLGRTVSFSGAATWKGLFNAWSLVRDANHERLQKELNDWLRTQVK
jgi:hypothetical protein